MRCFFALTLALTLASAAPTYAGPLYSVDDGSSEGGIGLGFGGDLIWLNKFKVDPANPLIVDIQVMFGALAVVPNGTAITLAIWKDTDGKVADAMLQNIAKGVVANTGKEVFNTYVIPTTLETGDFYVGLMITHKIFENPASIDTDNSQHQSFFAGGAAGTGNLMNLGANQMPVQSIDPVIRGNWMIRADGQPSAVPEPASLTLLGLGMAGMAAYGWRRRKQRVA
jgi:hypothetical protein